MMQKKNILIVEDEVLIANYLKRSLEKHGYHCSGIAISYDQAVVNLQANKPDAVLLDVNIFGKKSGIDLGNLINDQYKIPFLYLTSYTDAATLQQLKESFPKAYLVKPINEMALITNLDLLFESINKESPEIIKFEIGTTLYKIDPSLVYFIKSDANYVELHLATEKKLIRSSLKNMIEIFPKGYLVKINRRVALNPQYISERKGNSIKTKFGKTFKVSALLKADLSDIK